MIVAGTGCRHKTTASTEAKEKVTINKTTIKPEQNTTVTIRTYEVKRYTVNGKTKVVQEGKAKCETVLELKGTLKEHEEIKPLDEEDEPKRTRAAVVLTVYVDDQVYSFYSTHEPQVREEGDENHIGLYGYLEAYSTANNNYST